MESLGKPIQKVSQDIGKSTLPYEKKIARVWVEDSSYPFGDIIGLNNQSLAAGEKLVLVNLKTKEE